MRKKIVVYIRYTLICGYALLDFEHLNGKRARRYKQLEQARETRDKDVSHFYSLVCTFYSMKKKSKEVIQRCPNSLSFSVSLSAVHLVIL